MCRHYVWLQARPARTRTVRSGRSCSQSSGQQRMKVAAQVPCCTQRGHIAAPRIVVIDNPHAPGPRGWQNGSWRRRRGRCRNARGAAAPAGVLRCCGCSAQTPAPASGRQRPGRSPQACYPATPRSCRGWQTRATARRERVPRARAEHEPSRLALARAAGARAAGRARAEVANESKHPVLHDCLGVATAEATAPRAQRNCPQRLGRPALAIRQLRRLRRLKADLQAVSSCHAHRLASHVGTPLPRLHPWQPEPQACPPGAEPATCIKYHVVQPAKDDESTGVR